ncbi:hypothetical protein IEQ34_001710 [Dendrobium chrysotoxum]|uniref:Uncharacterized protein n=1 Tax=Dendrobium chrysotoxum TaxID=161865 RepID=A0AAV7HP13_DENCH|nr:hypothetical protein IEQ34_001710 [Dendrobium chrysotoxum]
MRAIKTAFPGTRNLELVICQRNISLDALCRGAKNQRDSVARQTADLSRGVDCGLRMRGEAASVVRCAGKAASTVRYAGEADPILDHGLHMQGESDVCSTTKDNILGRQWKSAEAMIMDFRQGWEFWIGYGTQS